MPLPSATKEVSPKIRALVDSISQLTLLEVADLVGTLKTELNIADAAPVAFAAGPAAPTTASPRFLPDSFYWAAFVAVLVALARGHGCFLTRCDAANV